jgi:pimeloyl-ACP methyl ester carboxylesterase
MISQTHPCGPTPTTAASATAPVSTPPAPESPGRRLRWIVTSSLTTGLLTALLLAAAPFVPAQEDSITGAVLIGFAVGWAMLAGLSVRFTATPQRWAAVPALFMGLGGLLLLAFGASIRPALDWMWPPAALALAIWTTSHARRRLPRGSGRRLLYPVIAVLALLSLGAGYETAAGAVDARSRTMPGQLVDIGGHRLHLSCTGTGSPTVVLEPGAGEMAANLGWVAPTVARTTRVCVYDRAGRGWSDPTDTTQDGARIATDLHTLLHRAGVPGPYVLAGHSFGGLYVLAFAARYAGEVTGMVLVDTTAPATAGPPTPADGHGESDALRRVSTLASTTARFGLPRLYAAVSFGDLPAQSRDDVRTSVASSTTVRSVVDEYLAGSASIRDASALRDFGDKPLVVLTAGVGNSGTWVAAQDRLATLSTDTVHRVVPGATHEALVAEQLHAATTAQAIVDVVTSVRNEQPLRR